MRTSVLIPKALFPYLPRSPRAYSLPSPPPPLSTFPLHSAKKRYFLRHATLTAADIAAHVYHNVLSPNERRALTLLGQREERAWLLNALSHARSHQGRAYLQHRLDHVAD